MDRQINLMSGKTSVANPEAVRLKIGFILARSFTLSAFALFVDTLRLASDTADNSGRLYADWQVISSARQLIRSSCGVEVAPTSGFVDPARFDYIAVVGGLLNTENPVDAETIRYLKDAAARKIPLLGVCTGTFILAAAGLMRQHQTCVSWLHYQAFKERFPDHKVRADRIFNLDRQRGSCAGGASAADLAASLVRRHISRDAEKNALEVLQIERARSTHDIQPRRPIPVESHDPRLRTALIMMEQNIDNKMPLSRIASSIGVSRRQLERLFKTKSDTSPALAYKKIRMERAKFLLAKTHSPLIEIALEAGFDTAAAFAKQFRKTYGLAPTKFRAASAGAE